MIYLKNKHDLELINYACKVWNITKNELIKFVKVGVTTKQIDEYAKQIIEKNNCTCSFFEYQNFPANICISVNDQLLHGIGDSYEIKNGDLITLDIGVTYQERICDSAFSIVIGENNEAKKIKEVCDKCLVESIKNIKPGDKTGAIGECIEKIAKQNAYEVVKQFAGHGCGIKLHEDPLIFCYGKKTEGVELKKGMVLCIEPMIMTGSDKFYIEKSNGWTVIAKNHKLTCHCEHMIYVDDDKIIDLIETNN